MAVSTDLPIQGAGTDPDKWEDVMNAAINKIPLEFTGKYNTFGSGGQIRSHNDFFISLTVVSVEQANSPARAVWGPEWGAGWGVGRCR